MFQRLKGFNLDSFLDSKIAEEQAKQRGGQPSGPKRNPSGARRSAGSRNESPVKRPSSRLRDPEGDKGLPPGKGPDPSEFIIEDEDVPSRTTTPRPQAKEGEETTEKEGQAVEVQTGDQSSGVSEKAQEKAPAADVDGQLPQDIQAKLRKLQKLENRYHDLLRSYRVAHARVSAIEPFEAALREHTPLASILEPSALVEYLSQVNLKGEMVMDELKRVSGDRDSIKAKLDEAEKKTKEAYDEAAGLRAERDTLLQGPMRSSDTSIEKEAVASDPLGATNGDTKVSEKHAGVSKDKDDDFFSYESELPRLQAELEEKSHVIEKLNSENATLRNDLEAAQSSHQDMVHNVEDASAAQGVDSESSDREKAGLQNRCDEAESLIQYSKATLDSIAADIKADSGESESLPSRIAKLGDLVKSAQSASDSAQAQVAEWQSKSETSDKALGDQEVKYKILQDSTSTASNSDKRRVETLDGIVKTLRAQLEEAEAAKEQANKTTKDTTNALYDKLTEMKEKMMVEQAAERASGRPTDVGILRELIAKAERERDDAYQVILDCGHCGIPGLDVPASADAAPVESNGGEVEQTTPEVVEEPAVTPDVDPSAAKKKGKNKKKNNKKKGNAAPAATEQPEVKSAEKAAESSPKSGEEVSKSSGSREARVSAIKEYIAQKNPHSSCDKTIQELKDTIEKRDVEIKDLQSQIETSRAAINRLDAKLKGEEELREEIEGLKDDLMHIGNEHVAAKDQVKTLREQKQTAEDENAESMRQLEHLLKQKTEEHGKVVAETEALKAASGSSSKELEQKMAELAAEKKSLEDKVTTNEKELSESKEHHASINEKSKDLSKNLEESRSEASSLRTDLSAANDLSQSRYKDLTALREHVNKITPELHGLKNESTRLQSVIEELNKDNKKLQGLESKFTNLQSEVSELKKRVQDKEVENKSLSEKIKQSNERTSSLEDKESKAQKGLARIEVQHKEATTAKDKLTRELATAQQELQTTRTSLEDLQKQTEGLSNESRRAKDELELKSAQQASAQSLMDSMQDQTRELATQMKEVRERCESLEEELADAHRLLSERSREGETMRRLLADVENRADARIKEMRDRMDLAIEERDRAEDDASATGRRKAREVEDLRNKLKEAERERASAVEDREAFEKRESGFQSQRESLEKRAAQAREELVEVRAAMTQLRDALDEGERQSREVEKEKAELKRVMEDKDKRLERLQKSSKTMADELRALQTSANKPPQSSIASTRSSIESSRVMSPARNGSVATTGGPDAQPAMDYVYLKNVLLQFLEQKDKKHQMQLVPVLGMLLHFDRKDEQKWMSAITAK